MAPEDWRGALPITYRIGPGPARVHMKLSFDWQTRPLYNVIVRHDGSDFPDQWVLHGNHHDFQVPEVEEKAKPSPEQIEENKEKWGYSG